LLKFHGDAIVLSGATGTKLKCEILGDYYKAWWGITSGGESKQNRLPTSIIELNAGSGEDYIEETGETILGSAGHALDLKLGGGATSKLKVVLVEDDAECYEHLKSVIGRKWPACDITKAEGSVAANDTGVYLLSESLDDAINTIEDITLGNSLFFFDPLLYVPWSEIDRVAKKRIKAYYMSRTEFVVFLFTSDWFIGRPKLVLAPLPKKDDAATWNESQRDSVTKMDDLFGMKSWRRLILSPESDTLRIDRLVAAYRDRLHKWFRYVVPMPFKPKEGQLYHLFMCSNYELGITLTKRFYSEYTGNAAYSPDNPSAYSRFKVIHPDFAKSYSGNQRPLVWKMLWAVIKYHDEGICDIRCDDFRNLEESWQGRLSALQMLQALGYLKKEDSVTDAWPDTVPLYRLDWDVVRKNLGVSPPNPLSPMEPKAPS